MIVIKNYKTIEKIAKISKVLPRYRFIEIIRHFCINIFEDMADLSDKTEKSVKNLQIDDQEAISTLIHFIKVWEDGLELIKKVSDNIIRCDDIHIDLFYLGVESISNMYEDMLVTRGKIFDDELESRLEEIYATE